MLYKTIHAVPLIIYAFLSSPIAASTYAVSTDPNSDYDCPDQSTCDIYCDKAEEKENELWFHCNDAAVCNFHCDERKCGALAIIYGDNSNILNITSASNGQECFKGATIYAPTYGSAYFSTQSSKTFKEMTVYAESNTEQIIIECDSINRAGSGDDCKSMKVYASTAQFLRVTVSNYLVYNEGTIACPVDSQYSGPDPAPCIIDATTGYLESIRIYAPEGIPEGVYIPSCFWCSLIEISCNAGLEQYPSDSDRVCTYTSNPTTNPTTNPTQTPTKIPTQTTTHNPTQSPTRNPSVPTYHPHAQTTPIVDPTIVPSMSPTDIYGWLWFLCYYNDNNSGFYVNTRNITLVEYAQIMTHGILDTMEAVDGYSVDYHLAAINVESEWKRGGIDFKMCIIYNDEEVDTDCTLYPEYDKRDNISDEYLAMGSFQVVSSNDIDSYKQYVIETMQSDPFKDTFNLKMNIALGNTNETRRRTLLQNGFNAVYIEIIDTEQHPHIQTSTIVSNTLISDNIESHNTDWLSKVLDGNLIREIELIIFIAVCCCVCIICLSCCKSWETQSKRQTSYLETETHIQTGEYEDIEDEEPLTQVDANMMEKDEIQLQIIEKVERDESERKSNKSDSSSSGVFGYGGAEPEVPPPVRRQSSEDSLDQLQHEFMSDEINRIEDEDEEKDMIGSGHNITPGGHNITPGNYMTPRGDD